MTLRNLYFEILTSVLRGLQRLCGASTVGVRTLVIDQQQRVLLVKHTYRSGWHFPGGGVNRGETAGDAAIRELWEETRVRTLQIPKLFGVYFHKVRGVNDYPILYVITEFEVVQENYSCGEIKTVAWFHYTALPADVGYSTKKRIDEFFYNNPIAANW